MQLATFFDQNPRFALAFSGGCDSAVLLSAAVKAGCDVKAYMVKTAFQPDAELDDARRVIESLNVPFEVIEYDILAREDICANPPDRCYLCKHAIFSTIRAAMERDGFAVLADGTNLDDNPERRPGFRALAELEVVSPLRLAGMTKEQVRALGRELGSPMADKPSFPCLAAFLPEGQRITADSLQ